MALQLQIFQKSTGDERPFDADDGWSQFRPPDSATRAPSRNLACWRKMMKSKVSVDPHTLQPDPSLIKLKAEWQIDPKKWGPRLSKNPVCLLDMLRQSQALGATDPRDRVRATLNLVIDYDDDGYELDYENSLAEHYLSIAWLLPFKCNSLQCLVMARTPIIPDPTVQGLPLWVPNWNMPGNAEYFLSSFHTAADLPMYGTPFKEDKNDGIFHVRGVLYTKVDRALSTIDNSLSPLSALSNLFISAIKSTGCHRSDIIKLASALVGPAIAELRIGNAYFSESEEVLYTGILLSYSFITPGLRIVDLLPYSTNVYDKHQR
ncbi:hypothetical protein G6011_08197 [Alternaria panax]|uniref:Uncharacterized protein n=1 Tax=Alternaria panax TaxID=48097 RepID=A0AAD4I9X3_9PLEO|nr:hypothetical protein G6011_08197 [Alternaria panax]